MSGHYPTTRFEVAMTIAAWVPSLVTIGLIAWLMWDWAHG